VFGPGVYGLLKKVYNLGTLKEAAQDLGMSYRYAWGLIKKAEEAIGEPLIEGHKGGRSGGSTTLTKIGVRFMEDFTRFMGLVEKFSELSKFDFSSNEVNGMVERIEDIDEYVEVKIKAFESRMCFRISKDMFPLDLDIGGECNIRLRSYVESVSKY
jgi:molybdate transport repressor ModE-like protein